MYVLRYVGEADRAQCDHRIGGVFNIVDISNIVGMECLISIVNCIKTTRLQSRERDGGQVDLNLMIG